MPRRSSLVLDATPATLLRFVSQTATAAFQLQVLLYALHNGQPLHGKWRLAAYSEGTEPLACAVVSRKDGYCLLHAVDDAAAWALLTELLRRYRINALAGEADVVQPLREHPQIAHRVFRMELEHFMRLRAFDHKVEPDGNYRLARPEDIPALRAYAAGYSMEHDVIFDCDWHDEIARGNVLVADALPPDPTGQIASCLMRGGITDQAALCSGVYTFPRFRNRSYAQRLVANFALEAAVAGLDTCLYVGTTNRPALAAYRRVGFFHVGDYLILYLGPNR